MSPANARETIQARRDRLSSVPRACEACKIRKIRCDRTTPCANCLASNITCRHPNDKSKSQLQADKIANLEALVERLEQSLHNVESRLAVLERSHPNNSLESSSNLDIQRIESDSDNSGHPFEGTSSFTSQSLQAGECAQMVSLAMGSYGDSAIDHSLNQLHTTLGASNGLGRSDFFFRKSVSKPTQTVQHLPISLVTCILRRMRVCRPIFLSSYAVSDLSLVESLCQKVYFQSNSASVGEFASVHGALFFVLKELIAMKDQLCEKFDMTKYLAQCEQLLVSAIESYEILAVPSFENILALTFGMIKSQGEGKPYLYWNLASSAVTHCQSLGYHRELTYRNLSSSMAENTRRLFWTVYTFDKNMSLVLGRVSNMQSLEIDTQYPTPSADLALRAWDQSFIMGIKLAELQGQIFLRLYSNTTMNRVTDERKQIISDLADMMGKWHADLNEIDPQGVNNPQIFHLSRGNWDILFYSTLTLLFRASSTIGEELHINSNCFNAACNSLRAHLDFFPQYQESQLLSDGDYFNWILSSSSFVPFIITFLHAVATKEMSDVLLLEQVLSTWESFRGSSRGSERQYQICATFTQVAKRLAQSEQSPFELYNEQENSLNLPGPSPSTSLLYPEIFEDAFTQDESNYANPLFATDILDDWLNGPPFPWEKLDG